MPKTKDAFALDDLREVKKIIPLAIIAIDNFLLDVYSKINDMTFSEMVQTNLALKAIIDESYFFMCFFFQIDDKGQYGKITDSLNQTLDRCYSAQAYFALKFVKYQSQKYQRRLKQARLAVGMTQQEVADKLNISRNAYTMYETGKRDISTLTLAQLSVIYQQSTDWLLGITD